MKLIYFGFSFLILLGLSACGSQKNESDSFDINAQSKKSGNKEKASTKIDLVNKGVGPIQSISLSDMINEERIRSGKLLYESKCTICHKTKEVFIGPALSGVLKRRTPEWVMNMMLNPEKMLRDDPLAQALFMEFNGTPMTNQGLSIEEARSILAYLSSLN